MTNEPNANAGPPERVADTIRYHRERCLANTENHQKPPVCPLAFRPDLTESDEDGTYYHAVCGLKWTEGHYDEDGDPYMEDEQCYTHPVIAENGDTLGDWG